MIFGGKWKGFKIAEYMYFTLCRPTWRKNNFTKIVPAFPDFDYQSIYF